MPRDLFPFIILAIFLVLEIYVFQSVKASFAQANPATKKIAYSLYWVLSLGITAAFFYGSITQMKGVPEHIRNFLFLLMFGLFLGLMFVSVFMILEDASRAVRWASSKFISISESSEGNNISRSTFLNQLMLLAGSVPFFTIIYGILVNPYRYQFHNITIPIKNLPDNLKDLKIIQLSDIHAGSFKKTEPIKKAVDQINEMNPDIIFFTGDLVNSTADEIEPYMEIFGSLKAKYGVFSILGNHDYGWRMESGEEKDENMERLKENHAKMGWRLLLNENEVIEINGEKLAVAGVENWGKSHYFPKKGDVAKALESLDPLIPTILLSHDPSHWDEKVLDKVKQVDLTLSGHTHGFQFGIENRYFKWSPVQYSYPRWAGLYTEGDQKLYVNRGFGFIGYPGRVGILPEISVISLA